MLVAASNNRGGTELGWPASANGVISVESADVNQQLSDEAVSSPPPATPTPTPKATEPTNATNTTDDADSTSTVPLIIGGVLVLLAITGAILTRRTKRGTGAGPP